MTETPDKRMLVIPQPLWDKVVRRAFTLTEKGKARVSYSQVVRMALDKFFAEEKSALEAAAQ